MSGDDFHFQPIGIVRSCYKTKFGIPRQSGLIEEATGAIELLPPCNQPDAVRGLADFSHIWVLFVFHEALRKQNSWKATVRPPRLGGDKRLGVFATRSPFRPCPIGLSALRLTRVECAPGGHVRLHVAGLDLVDGTPVLDVKPYLPYADCLPDATGGFAPTAPDTSRLAITFSPDAEETLKTQSPSFRELCRKVIASDPRPAYQRIPGREYQCYLGPFEILWVAGADAASATITQIRRHHEK